MLQGKCILNMFNRSLAMLTNGVTDTSRRFCDSLWKESEYREGILIEVSQNLILLNIHNNV